ncbi:hypothetical protein GCM10010274_18500 [Streptomyces lavendofoliae]|uniref:Uncharacterized protein n=1 Tax=Streptomyces lavendofoliae TaxID=67314 RepID=A0A918HV38_9ACTN|nr:hypothetical protein GCM10010274_18500 [Streptomyces lavendofoliae]
MVIGTGRDQDTESAGQVDLPGDGGAGGPEGHGSAGAGTQLGEPALLMRLSPGPQPAITHGP